MWAYGGDDDGSLLLCGADYPTRLMTWMYKYTPIDLRYVAKGEYSAKVWTNLAPGAQVCLSVAQIESGNCVREDHWPAVTDYHGVCRSGQTGEWEDLTLDLPNVPGLGNVLGERVCIDVQFWGGEPGSATRPEGAYVDDVRLQLCPEGLSTYCAGTGGEATPTTMASCITPSQAA